MMKLLSAKMEVHLQFMNLLLNDNRRDIFRRVYANTRVLSVFVNVTMFVSGQMMLTW